MDFLTADRLAALLATIYEAAVAPERWVDVLTGLRADFQLTFATMATYSADRSRVVARAVGVEQGDYQGFLDKHFQGNQFSTETRSRSAGGIVPSRGFIDPEAFRRSDMYQEFHRARDMGEGLRLDIWREAESFRSIAFFRPWPRGFYEPAELAVCAAIMPHLQRATALSFRLQQADLMAKAALEALDRIAHAIFLLDAGGQVRHMNASGDAAITARTALGIAGGMLHASDPSRAAGLEAAVGRAAGRGGGTPSASMLRLSKRAGGTPLAVLVSPFPSATQWSLPHRPTVLVCASDPDAMDPMPSRDLMDLFGLTEAEAALANDLLAGHDVQDVAERRGRSVHTIRSHLARLMEKAGVNRQAQLIRLLATLPRRNGRHPSPGA